MLAFIFSKKKKLLKGQVLAVKTQISLHVDNLITVFAVTESIDITAKSQVRLSGFTI